MGRHEYYAKVYVDLLDCDDLWSLAGKHGQVAWSAWTYLILTHRTSANGKGWIQGISLARMQRDLNGVVPEDLIRAYERLGMVEIDGDLGGRFDLRVSRAMDFQPLSDAQRQQRKRDTEHVTQTRDGVTETRDESRQQSRIEQNRIDSLSKGNAPGASASAHTRGSADAFFIFKAIDQHRDQADTDWSEAIWKQTALEMQEMVDPKSRPKSTAYWLKPSPVTKLSRLQECLNRVLEAGAAESDQRAAALKRGGAMPPDSLLAAIRVSDTDG